MGNLVLWERDEDLIPGKRQRQSLCGYYVILG